LLFCSLRIKELVKKSKAAWRSGNALRQLVKVGGAQKDQ
jgi:hypothetical protein